MHQFNEEFWNQKYLLEEDAWDLKSVSPPIANYIDQLDNKDLKILIPGCGNAYEAMYLLEKGFKNIELIDISSEIADKLNTKFHNLQNPKIYHQDFFALNGRYDLILEQTFFCALDPILRQKYAEKMHELLNPNGKLVGLLFDKNFENDSPPFGGDLTTYQSIFEAKFEIKTMEKCTNSIKPRLGHELFIILKPKL